MERQVVDVLVVDDTEGVREGIADVLRHLGLEVHTAANGREAMLLLYQAHYAVMLLDYEMPEMDGMAVASALRERAQRPIVLMMSGGVDMAEAPIDGTVVQAFLEKPFDIREVAEIIQLCVPKFRGRVRDPATTT